MKYKNTVTHDLNEFSALSDERFFNLARNYGTEFISKANACGVDGCALLVALGKVVLGADYSISENEAGLIKIMGRFSNSIEQVQSAMRSSYKDKYDVKSALNRCGLSNGPSGPAYACVICMIVLDGRVDYEELELLEYLLEC